MPDTQRITDPTSLFAVLNTELPDLNVTPSDLPRSSPQTQLVLLQPLAKAEMLAACRESDSRVSHSNLSGQIGGQVRATRKHEYLNLQPLSVAWRQAWTKVGPISQVIFDLTLPKEDEHDKDFQRVYWDVTTPSQGGIAVCTRDVMNLVITLATGTRMRVKSDVDFSVIYGETDGASLRGMRRLQKQLAALVNHKVPATVGKYGHQDRAK